MRFLLKNKTLLKKILVATLAITPIIVVPAYIYKTNDAKGGDAITGKDHYIAHCLVCHGETGAGDGIAATGLPKRPSNISKSLNNLFTYDFHLIRNVVLSGKLDAGMPAFEELLTEEQTKDIFAYVRSIN